MTIDDDDVPHGTKRRTKKRVLYPETVADCQPGQVVTIKAKLGQMTKGYATVWCRPTDGSGPYPLSMDWPIEGVE